MTKLIAVLERLEKRYANEHALFVLQVHDGRLPSWCRPDQAFAVRSILRVKRDIFRDLKEELQADAKALPERT